MLFHGPSNNILYAFNKNMGAGVGLTEPEPDHIIQTLSTFSRFICMSVNEALSTSLFNPVVQYGNESDMYFDDPYLVEVLIEETCHPNVPVYPIIHQISENQPLKPGFLEKMVQLMDLSGKFRSRNICVHLPLERYDVSGELIEELTGESFLDHLGQSNISIDLEQNWHESWFGIAENVISFFTMLEDKLQEIGRHQLFDNFGMTFDSGHFFAEYRTMELNMEEGIQKLFTELGTKIRTLHLHGNDGKNDEHVCFRRIHDDTKSGTRFRENQELLLNALPILALGVNSRREPWDAIIISEINKPFTKEEFLDHVMLIGESVKDAS
ncbi:MAG: hypothetical protein ACTSUE_26695 [Promethearchaeota archaeon]